MSKAFPKSIYTFHSSWFVYIERAIFMSIKPKFMYESVFLMSGSHLYYLISTAEINISNFQNFSSTTQDMVAHYT